MIKEVFLICLLSLLSSFVNAANPYVGIDNSDMDICLCVDNMTYCTDSTMLEVSATSDHYFYIMPCAFMEGNITLTNTTNIMTLINYPINKVNSALIFICAIVFGVMGFYCVKILIDYVYT